MRSWLLLTGKRLFRYVYGWQRLQDVRVHGRSHPFPFSSTWVHYRRTKGESQALFLSPTLSFSSINRRYTESHFRCPRITGTSPSENRLKPRVLCPRPANTGYFVPNHNVPVIVPSRSRFGIASRNIELTFSS